MNAKQKLHQARLNEWAERFADQKTSGLTVKQWCDQNHYSIHTYNYWKHLLKENVVDQMLPDIVPISVPALQTEDLTIISNEPAPVHSNCTIRANRAIATLRIGDISLEITPDITEDFLCKLIKAVRHA